MIEIDIAGARDGLCSGKARCIIEGAEFPYDVDGKVIE
jgi:hypothetical protein